MRSRSKNFWIAALIGTLWIALFNVYTETKLAGYSDGAILSSDMFGLPKHIEKKIEGPTYTRKNETGWDGQFHYFITNDPDNSKNSSLNIDNPPYRYSRPGIAPVLWLVQKLTRQRDIYLSPKTYLFLLGAILVSGVFCGSECLTKSGRSPLGLLPWALWPSCYFTTFNGLPDCLADSTFLIGVLCYMNRKRAIGAMVFSVALLSREIYLIPILLTVVMDCLIAARGVRRKILYTAGIATIPFIVLFVYQSWRTYAIGPVVDTGAVIGSGLDLPNELFVAVGQGDIFQLAGLVLHASILICAVSRGIGFVMYTGNRIKTRGLMKPLDYRSYCRSISSVHNVSAMIVAIAYLWLGNTVLMHYTGYMKADAVIILLLCLSGLNETERIDYAYKTEEE